MILFVCTDVKGHNALVVPVSPCARESVTETEIKSPALLLKCCLYNYKSIQ